MPSSEAPVPPWARCWRLREFRCRCCIWGFRIVSSSTARGIAVSQRQASILRGSLRAWSNGGRSRPKRECVPSEAYDSRTERPMLLVPKALLRIWTLRRVADIPTLATDPVVTVLGVAALALWIGVDRWRAGPGAQFELWDTLTVCAYALLLLLVAFTMSRASRPRVPIRGVLFALLAALPVLLAMRALIDMRSEGGAAKWAWALFALYGLAYAWRAMRSLS